MAWQDNLRADSTVSEATAIIIWGQTGNFKESAVKVSEIRESAIHGNVSDFRLAFGQ